jgi:hypothetical protein
MNFKTGLQDKIRFQLSCIGYPKNGYLQSFRARYSLRKTKPYFSKQNKQFINSSVLHTLKRAVSRLLWKVMRAIA